MDIQQLKTQLDWLEKAGVKEIRIAVGIRMYTLDSIVELKSAPIAVLCNDDYRKDL